MIKSAKKSKPTKADTANSDVRPFCQVTKVTARNPDLTGTALERFSAKVELCDEDYHRLIDELDYAASDIDESGADISIGATMLIIELTDERNVRVVLLKNAEILLAKTFVVRKSSK